MAPSAPTATPFLDLPGFVKLVKKSLALEIAPDVLTMFQMAIRLKKTSSSRRFPFKSGPSTRIPRYPLVSTK